MDILIEKYLTHLTAMNRAVATVASQGLLVGRFIKFLQASDIKNLNDVDDNLMLLYQHHVHNSKSRFGKAHSVAGQNSHLIAVRMFYKYLLRTGDATKDPTLLMELAREPHRLPVDILTETEMFRLLETPDLDTVMGLRNRAIMEVLYSSAIRRNELLNLNLPDICYETKSISIRQGKYNRDRVVPLGRIAEKYLLLYLQRRNELLYGNDTDAIFISFRGKRYNDESLRKMLIAYGKQAGLTKRIHPHLFRHCCSCHLLDNGAGVAEISALLGHGSLSTTTRYLQVSISSLRKAHQQFHPREQMKTKVA